MRSTVHLTATLVIHPAIPVPTHCAVCDLWGIERPATRFSQWGDQLGPDNYIGICDNCRMSGFPYIGTLDEFRACQLRAMGKAEYEVYGPRSSAEYRMCHSRNDAYGAIRNLISRGISIDAVYQRSITNGRLRKLNADEKAALVIEAMEV